MGTDIRKAEPIRYSQYIIYGITRIGKVVWPKMQSKETVQMYGVFGILCLIFYPCIKQAK